MIGFKNYESHYFRPSSVQSKNIPFTHSSYLKSTDDLFVGQKKLNKERLQFMFGTQDNFLKSEAPK